MCKEHSLHSQWDSTGFFAKICINCPLQLTSTTLTIIVFILLHLTFLTWLAFMNSTMELAALKLKPGISISFNITPITEPLTASFSGGIMVRGKFCLQALHLFI